MDQLSQPVIIIIISSIFLVVVAAGIILLVLIYQKRQLVFVREKAELKAHFENQILESKLEIQEQTLKNISQEIHDNIGQVLSLAKLTINTMNPDEPIPLAGKIESSKTLVSKAIEDLRHLSRNLSTEYITDLGLAVSITNEVRLLSNAIGYQVKTIVSGEVYRLHQQEELIIFRIFQEVLQNIIKHASASEIIITVAYHLDRFRLCVQDNGKGFIQPGSEQASNEKIGLGMRNMGNRARLIGASLQIKSTPGQGTEVDIILPVKTSEHAG